MKKERKDKEEEIGKTFTRSSSQVRRNNDFTGRTGNKRPSTTSKTTQGGDELRLGCVRIRRMSFSSRGGRSLALTAYGIPA